MSKPTKEKLILVIDDDKELCEFMVDILTPDGYRVITAENGEIGLKMARENKPGVILLDVMMPVLDGYGFLDAQRADPTIASIPIIVLSAGVMLDRIPKEIPRLPKPPALLVLFALIESKMNQAADLAAAVAKAAAPKPASTPT